MVRKLLVNWIYKSLWVCFLNEKKKDFFLLLIKFIIGFLFDFVCVVDKYKYCFI